MAILNNNPLVGASGNQGGYNINNSLRFRSSASAYLTRTFAGSPTTFTVSMWVKRGALGTRQELVAARGSGGTAAYFEFNSSDQLNVTLSNVSGNAGSITTTAVYRDPSAWYHIMLTSASGGTTYIYVNGTQVGSASASSGYFLFTNTANYTNTIGQYGDYNGFYLDGYMADVYFIDGSAKTPSDFGETDTTTGVWKPKAYTGTYGTNGFYLKFSDIATTSGSNAGLGKDFSGNTNYWTTNNISVTSGTTYDAMTDSPTLTSATVANYATLNYIDTNTASSISGANLNWVDAGGIDREIRGTIGVSSGKYYWEVVLTSSNTSHVGVDTLNSTLLTNYLGSTSTSWSIYLATGNKRNAGSNTSYGSSLAANDIMMCALDMDNGKIWWGKNGTWFASGDPAAGTNAAFTNLSGYTIAFAATPRSSCSVNFGQRPFSYTPPTGFNRLNTYNLPTSTIVKGNTVMDATLYTGNSSTQTITNAGAFKPDLVWLKCRSTAGTWNNLVDSVRGASKTLYSNTTNAEGTDNYLSAFNSNGFGLNVGDSGTNTSGNTYVGWQWQAGQGSTSSNTSGSITSTVSANTTAGFSVVTYAGNSTSSATVGHGLGVSPSMVIIKNRSSVTNWVVRHSSLSSTQNVSLNTTDAVYTVSSGTANGGVGAFTSTTFGFISGTTGLLSSNQTSNNYVAYCWAAIPGFSAFGSYTGNGSTDGPFVYCGFRPKYILIKRTDTTSDWHVHDAARNTYNVTNNTLYPSGSYAEDTNHTAVNFDFTANGFKLRSSHPTSNNNGSSHIFIAFAENPFKNSLAR